MITHSGVHVWPGTETAPTIEDIAISLGRVPRFCGHTNRWWPVLLHTLVCFRIWKEEGYARDAPDSAIHVLLHDAHESVIGDIPRTWKTDVEREVCHQLDRRLYNSLRLSLPHAAEQDIIRTCDDKALLAEAFVVGPPGVFDWLEERHGRVDATAINLVREVARDYPEPFETNGRYANAVCRFIALCEEFLRETE